MLSALNIRRILGGGFATLFRISINFAVNKFLASLLGPAGFAMVGQFQNLLLGSQAIGSLALQNGWVSLTARFRNHDELLPSVWSAGLRLTAMASTLTSMLLAIFAQFGALDSLFPGLDSWEVRMAILLSIPGTFGITINLLCQSVANGLGRHKMWESLVTVTAFLQGLWVVLLLWLHYPVLPVLATQSIITALISLIALSRRGFTLSHMRLKSMAMPDWIQYAMMGILPMLLSPIAQTIVRYRISTTLGIDAAGLWQGGWRISDFFNVGLSAMLGAVLLPQFSTGLDRETMMRKVWKSLLGTMLFTLFLVIVMIILRVPLVHFVLSSDFAPLSNFLPLQLIGDVFRSGGWVLGMALLARQATPMFMLLETFCQLLFVAIAWFGISYLGLAAPFLAYAMENVVYFVSAIFILRKIRWNP